MQHIKSLAQIHLIVTNTKHSTQHYATQLAVQYVAQAPNIALHKHCCNGGHCAINCNVTHVDGTSPF